MELMMEQDIVSYADSDLHFGTIYLAILATSLWHYEQDLVT